jgi:hypothetical protein
LQLKIKLFNTCVKSVLLYGCETWFVTNNITQKLQAFVNRCLWNILGIWWPRIITNQELWGRTEHSTKKWKLNLPQRLRMERTRKKITWTPQSHLEAHCFGGIRKNIIWRTTSSSQKPQPMEFGGKVKKVNNEFLKFSLTTHNITKHWSISKPKVVTNTTILRKMTF